MNQCVESSKRITTNVFLGGCLLAAICIFLAIAGVPPDRLWTRRDVLGMFFILTTPFIPAVLIGRLIGPKLVATGYWRNVGWQMLAVMAWAIFNVLCLFLIIYFDEIRTFTLNSGSANSLLRKFSSGFGFFFALYCALLLPITLMSSRIALIFIRKRDQP